MNADTAAFLVFIHRQKQISHRRSSSRSRAHLSSSLTSTSLLCRAAAGEARWRDLQSSLCGALLCFQSKRAHLSSQYRIFNPAELHPEYHLLAKLFPHAAQDSTSENRRCKKDHWRIVADLPRHWRRLAGAARRGARPSRKHLRLLYARTVRPDSLAHGDSQVPPPECTTSTPRSCPPRRRGCAVEVELPESVESATLLLVGLVAVAVAVLGTTAPILEGQLVVLFPPRYLWRNSLSSNTRLFHPPDPRSWGVHMVHWSIHRSIHWSFGPFIGPFIGPLVYSSVHSHPTVISRLHSFVSKAPLTTDVRPCKPRVHIHNKRLSLGANKQT